MISQYFCNTGLTLGSTSLDHHNPDHHHLRNRDERKSSLRFDHAIPSLTLGLISSEEEKHQVSNYSVLFRRQVSHSISATSSYSNNSSVKRERDGVGEEAEVERERCSKVGGDHDQDLEEGSVARKKLRLSKEQSVVLEDRFKEHSSLNPQKQTLAKQLNLQPRQVEVWFQNRRARTKLKQTEVECELLRKCCDTLTDENKRLRNEIQELKALKKTAPFYMQLPAAVATLTVCPSCERHDSSGENSSKSLFSIGAKSHFYNSFTHPSAACLQDFK
ncbi:homeobox-leucine zipper protein HAT22-like isoform X2 [Rhododendron vialii]|uniref:homeobox-leucine zipper protein HAT22-like isoform X2 n=1 Tax=Rhododendron vialii TaxID=182163 RepID=UPI00265DD24F|nr:homeobox-leucine zipper protein HAT22-like isoform X2 [Rhododendron vialii]